MLIKFKKPDPRAGDTVRMDSSLGQGFIDMGHADRLPENWETTPSAAAPEAELADVGDGDDSSDGEDLGDGAGDGEGEGEGEGEDEGDGADADELKQAAAAFIDGTVPDVTGRIDGADKALLAAALAAETAKEEKARKGVIDALTAALAPAQS